MALGHFSRSLSRARAFVAGAGRMFSPRRPIGSKVAPPPPEKRTPIIWPTGAICARATSARRDSNRQTSRHYLHNVQLSLFASLSASLSLSSQACHYKVSKHSCRATRGEQQQQTQTQKRRGKANKCKWLTCNSLIVSSSLPLVASLRSWPPHLYLPVCANRVAAAVSNCCRWSCF